MDLVHFVKARLAETPSPHNTAIRHILDRYTAARRAAGSNVAAVQEGNRCYGLLLAVVELAATWRGHPDWNPQWAPEQTSRPIPAGQDTVLAKHPDLARLDGHLDNYYGAP